MTIVGMTLMFIVIWTLLVMNVVATNMMVFNIIGDSKEETLAACKETINYLTAMHKSDINCKDHVMCRGYISKEFFDDIKQHVESELDQLLHSKLNYVDSQRCVDTSIGQEIPVIEHASQIIWALQHVISTTTKEMAKDLAVLSLTFSPHSFPVFNAKFPHMLEHMSKGKVSKKLFLLDKTKELGSVSDWHDLMLLMFDASSPAVYKWLSILSETFLHHANRPVFSLLHPRPALMEAAHQMQSELQVSYFSASDVCVLVWEEKDRGHRHRRQLTSTHNTTITTSITNGSAIDSSGHSSSYSRKARRRLDGEVLGGSRSINTFKGDHPSFCRNDAPSAIHINCAGGDGTSQHACSTLFVPQSWKVSASAPVKEDSDSNYHEGFTVARYRLSQRTDKPLDYCWHTG
jgi:hypothetical protein